MISHEQWNVVETTALDCTEYWSVVIPQLSLASLSCSWAHPWSSTHGKVLLTNRYILVVWGLHTSSHTCKLLIISLLWSISWTANTAVRRFSNNPFLAFLCLATVSQALLASSDILFSCCSSIIDSRSIGIGICFFLATQTKTVYLKQILYFWCIVVFISYRYP